MINIVLHTIFIFSIIFIWLMLIYQFILSVGGFLWRQKLLRLKNNNLATTLAEEAMPQVSILIPCRNEEKVIKRTVEKMLALKYPQDKLEIMVINDGSSDNTKKIVIGMSKKHKNVVLMDIPEDISGRGKGAALNICLQKAKHELIAIYDADNLPHSDSLIQLVSHLQADPKLAAVTGKFRAYNKGRNLLTRLINIESIAFQWIIQAGRWFLLGISMLPGTNFVIRRSVLTEVGGWDEEALTEDTELTFRIYHKGYKVKFIPDAVTQEQEPERLATWIRQRTRWARGNNYIISKFNRSMLKKSNRLISLELMNLFYLYYLFVFAILFSDVIFILSLFNIVDVKIAGPYMELWILAFLLFVLEIILALHYEGEDSFTNFILTLFAYFTYTKLWVVVVLISLYQDIIQKKERSWAKTERFDSPYLLTDEYSDENTTKQEISSGD